MNYNGIEIFVQNLGDADSIFVRHWANGVLTNILIDGGWKKDADQVEAFLRDRAKETGIAMIHHLVCSHSHDDHAQGLVELVDRKIFPISQAWVHDTRTTHRVFTESRSALLTQLGTSASRVLADIRESEETRHTLLASLEQHRIPISSPFAGARIGPGMVLGPTESFFESQFKKLENINGIETWNQKLSHQWLEGIFDTESILEKRAQAEDEKELGSDPVSPENEVSTVIAFASDTEICLLTGDVGCEGLSEVVERHQNHLRSVRWLQVPHHGSRRNMNLELIEHLAPQTSFISCEGTVKHPSRKLVNALKAQGGKVFSTHYSSAKGYWLRQSLGNTPPLSMVSAIPLYDKQ